MSEKRLLLISHGSLYRYDSENTRRQLNLFAASGIAVGLIIGCTVVAFFALVFALQPSIVILLKSSQHMC